MLYIMQICFLFLWKTSPICDGFYNLFWTHGCKPFSLTHPFWSLRMLMMHVRIAVHIRITTTAKTHASSFTCIYQVPS